MDQMLDLRIQNSRRRPDDYRAQEGLCQKFTGRLQNNNQRRKRNSDPAVAELGYSKKDPVEKKSMVRVNEGEEKSVEMGECSDHKN
jgi:hypothetical protein